MVFFTHYCWIISTNTKWYYKKKYYEFIQNLPLFIPIDEIGNYVSCLLDKYPVTPYLDNRDSFVRWVHFFHNKVNVYIGKEEISLADALETYRNAYKPRSIYLAEKLRWKTHNIFFLLAIILIILIYMWYE